MEKPSFGIIVFAIIFIVISLYYFWAGLTLYTHHRSMLAPMVHRAMTARLDEIEAFISRKIPADKKAEALEQLTGVRRIMEQYKKEYIDGRKIPAPLAVCAALSQLTGVIFFYTGITILRLRRNARRLISVSFLAGFLWYCIFLWSAFASASFSLHIAKRIISILALTEDSAGAPSSYSILTMASIPAVRMTIFAVLTGYLALMAGTSLFFSRKSIQEKFSNTDKIPYR